ncbi:hypothetical protein HOY34_05930 [Xinfangfangia sp. D13-10-4-6]|nr:hypothetical protein [Pseudogemmobacter hezensis]
MVQVDFAPAIISYDEVLSHFRAIHDPGSFDAQNDETRPGVRSAVSVHSPGAKRLAGQSGAAQPGCGPEFASGSSPVRRSNWPRKSTLGSGPIDCAAVR